MPVVKRILRRNARITVEAHAEVLFMPGGSVNSWAAKFVGQLRSRTIANTPSNRRPRWSHYGKPMKQTIVSARPRFWGNGRDKQRVYAAVGSTAPYSAFVDQGTGVYAGNGPYQAKILPPWTRGSGSLYEHTWIPPGSNRPVQPVMIRGQKGQEFFDKSLRDTMRFMRLSAFQVPSSPKISEALNSVPSALTDVLLGPHVTPGFMKSLAEWREWRDDAFSRGRRLGVRPDTGGYRAAAEKAATRRQAVKAAKAAKSTAKSKRTPPKPKPDPTKKPPRGYASVADKKAAAVAQFRKQNPNVRIIRQNPGGIVVNTGRGPYMIPWSRLYALID